MDITDSSNLNGLNQSELCKPKKNGDAGIACPAKHRKRDVKKAVKILDIGGSRARIGEPDPAIELLLKSHNARVVAVETLIDCLTAERTYYDLYAKAMVVEPDYATRRASACALLAYDVGEPVKRQQILIGQVDSLEDVEKKLASSPAMREQFKKMIAEAELKAQIPKVEPVSPSNQNPS